MNQVLKNNINKDIEAVNKTLSLLIKPNSKLTFDVYNQVINSGKRLRPLIVLYSAMSLELQDKENILLLGSIVELIHTASLLHDDIIDDANFRRGKPSANVIYGTKPAVLGGDYLYSLAFNMVLDFDVEIAKTISKAAYMLAEGEIQEIENTFKLSITIDDYYDIIYKKTAVLLEASSVSGALMANTTYKEQFRLYGRNLGFAFQIKDDCLDYEANSDVLGKDAGIDLKEGKITLPVIYAIQNHSSLISEIDEFFETKDENLLGNIIEQITKYGLKPSIKEAKRFSIKAKEALNEVKDSKYKEYLLAIADYAIERKR